MDATYTNHKGFTLVELMVVVGIIAIALAVATPLLNARLSRHRLGGAARDVLAAIQQARIMAARDYINVAVRFDSVSDRYIVFVDDGGSNPANAGNWTRDGDERLLISGAMPKDISLVADNFGANTYFYFDNRGMPFDGADALTFGTITLTNTANGAARKVELLLTGHSRIQ